MWFLHSSPRATVTQGCDKACFSTRLTLTYIGHYWRFPVPWLPYLREPEMQMRAVLRYWFRRTDMTVSYPIPWME